MRLTLSDALEIIANSVLPKLKTKKISLKKAVGKISSEDIYASFPIPLRDISLRDGVVITKYKTQDIRKCTKINTGDYLPKNTICVIEHEQIDFKTITPKLINHFKKNNFIKPRGEDIKKGEKILQKGKKISAFHIANLASQGIYKVKVYKKIKLSFIGVGNEIIDVSKNLQKHQVHNSNAYTIASRSKSLGAKIVEISNVKDNPYSLMRKIKSLKKCDCIVTIGGMSRNDTVDKILLNALTKVAFKKILLAPAGLSAFSFYKNTPILHLPGLPMSALLGFEILGVPLIYVLSGKGLKNNKAITTKISEDIKYNNRSQSIIPGFFDGKIFKPTKVLSGMMNVLNNCNGYILSPKKERVKKGEKVDFIPFLAWN